jgi:hypothetical protein
MSLDGAGIIDIDIDAVVISREDVKNFNPEQILPESHENIEKIRSWLQPTSYDLDSGEYRRNLASYVPGTGAWLTSSISYRQWLDGTQHGLLWIKGTPGSGKSVMAAKLIQDLTALHPDVPVLFFFFRQIVKANQEPAALLRDWLDQILLFSPPLQKQLQGYMMTRRTIDSISMEDLWKDLRMAFSSLSGCVYCIVDALDEIDPGHDRFLESLGSLGQWKPGKLKVLVTSRPISSVERALRNADGLHIRLQEDLVDIDISTYVQHTLEGSNISSDDRRRIIEAIPGHASGLFLYAKLAMDAFLETGADVQAVLSRLPTSLNTLYTNLLREHGYKSGVPADIQGLVLQAAVYTTRPLRLIELADIINVMGNFEQDLKATKNLVRAACGPLLEILADETICVIHHSFAEYLKGATQQHDDSGYGILRAGSAHGRLALACLIYLQAGCFKYVKVRSAQKNRDEDFEYNESDGYHYQWPDSPQRVKLRLQHPFFEYAASNWHYHVAESEAAGHDQAGINMDISKFLDSHQNMQAWLLCKWPGGIRTIDQVTQLHIAAKTGLVSYTKQLLSSGQFGPDICDADGKTPL